MAVTDSNGVVQERYIYDAFGNVNGLASDWNRTFTGQVYDNETGLMLYRNRFYSPELGRFLSRDPIGYEAGDQNVYRYVGNKVATSVDAHGLQAMINGSVFQCMAGGGTPQQCQDWIQAQNLPPILQPIPPAPPQSEATDGYTCCKEYKFMYQIQGYATPRDCIMKNLPAWMKG